MELKPKDLSDLRTAIKKDNKTSLKKFKEHLRFMKVLDSVHTGNLAEYYCKILWDMTEPVKDDGTPKKNHWWDLKKGNKKYEVKHRAKGMPSIYWRDSYEKIESFLYVSLDKDLLPEEIYIIPAKVFKGIEYKSKKKEHKIRGKRILFKEALEKKGKKIYPK